MIRKILGQLSNVLSILVILLSVFILLNVVMTPKGTVPNIMGYSFLRVMTGSMEPAIPTDSIIAVKQIPPEEVQPGDVISFYSTDPAIQGSINTHRVTSVRTDCEPIVFETKGDANIKNDDYPPNAYDLIGVVVFVSAGVGKFINIISNPVVFIPLVLIPLMVLIILNMVKAIHSAKKIMRAEEEAAVREALEMVRKKKEEKEAAESDPKGGES